LFRIPQYCLQIRFRLYRLQIEKYYGSIRKSDRRPASLMMKHGGANLGVTVTVLVGVAGVLIVGAITTVACGPVLPTDSKLPVAEVQQADGLLVKFKAHVNERQVHAISEKYGAVKVHALASPKQVTPGGPMAQWRHLEFHPDADLRQTMQRMVQDVDIEVVELNSKVSIQKQ
jgi:hypothetical protein